MNQQDELFTINKRNALLQAYNEKTGKPGEYLVCEHGFLWDSMGISDSDFMKTCEKHGIKL